MSNSAEVNKDGTTKIKVIKLINGTDIVCEIAHAEQKQPLITLDKPLEIKYVPQITNIGIKDYIALVKWAGYTNDKHITIPKDKIMTITNASLEMAGNYKHIIQNYDKLDRPKQDETYHKKEFTPEENKKLNEIFREFDDEEEPPTIH